MIKALRKRVRPDNLVNQVRAGGKSMARRLYLIALGAVGVFLVFALVGPLVFLDADALVTKERSVISTDFNARVIEAHVRSGDEVKAGALLVTVTSSETLDRIAELTTRVATAGNREATVKARKQQLSTLIPLTKERRVRAQAAFKQMESLVARQLTTANRVSEAARELHEAEREEAQLVGEMATIELDIAAAAGARKDFLDALDLLRKSYNGGRILAPVAGTIGPKVVSSGSAIRIGENALEIYRGEAYVVGYLPTSRMYNVEAGDTVVVTDGKVRESGRVVRVEAIADALPAEFQSVFSARERQQVVRVELDGKRAERFPIHSKVKVTGMVTPTNVVSLVKASVGFVADTVFGAFRAIARGVGSIFA